MTSEEVVLTSSWDTRDVARPELDLADAPAPLTSVTAKNIGTTGLNHSWAKEYDNGWGSRAYTQKQRSASGALSVPNQNRPRQFR